MDLWIELLKRELALQREVLGILKVLEEAHFHSDISTIQIKKEEIFKLQKELSSLKKEKEKFTPPLDDIEALSLLEQIQTLYKKIALQCKENQALEKEASYFKKFFSFNPKSKPKKKSLLMEDEQN